MTRALGGAGIAALLEWSTGVPRDVAIASLVTLGRDLVPALRRVGRG